MRSQNKNPNKNYSHSQNSDSEHDEIGGLERRVRTNLMKLVLECGAEDSYSQDAWSNWFEEAASPSEGMCVGWSLMFIEDEGTTKKLWECLQENNSTISGSDKTLYQDFGKKLWYRYINTTGELEDEKRDFKKLPIKMTENDLVLKGVKHHEDYPCKDVNRAKDRDELYKLLSGKVSGIIENNGDRASRNYIKVDNKHHSIAIAFNAFIRNKNVTVMETASSGIKEIKQDDKSGLRVILERAFGNNVVGTDFSLETFSRNLEQMKNPGTEVSNASIYSLLPSSVNHR